MNRAVRIVGAMALALGGVGMALQIARMRTAQALSQSGAGVAAAALRPQNAQARGAAAQAWLAARRSAPSAEHGRAALHLSPYAVAGAHALGVLAERSGGQGAGDQWLRLAGAMGWRHRPTQYWALQRALLTGDVDVAIARLDALLRVRADPRTLKLARLLATEPRAVPGLVERLALAPDWRRPLFDPPEPISRAELDGMTALLAGLGSTRSPPVAVDIRGAQRNLIAAGRFAEAVELDRQFIKRKPDTGSLIDDGGFDRPIGYYQSDSGALDWWIGVMGHGSAEIDKSGGNPSAAIVAQGIGRAFPMVRHVALAPGRYRLRYSMRGEASSPELVGIGIACVTAPNQWTTSSTAPLGSAGWEQRSLDFTVAPGCPLVRIGLGSLGEAPQPSEAQFDDLRLTRR